MTIELALFWVLITAAVFWVLGLYFGTKWNEWAVRRQLRKVEKIQARYVNRKSDEIDEHAHGLDSKPHWDQD